MGKRAEAWIRGHRRELAFLGVGGLTTLVNYALFLLLSGLGLHYLASNAAAWIGAVAFAYGANARWVYRTGRGLRWGEAGAFFLSRLFSLGLESLLLWVGVDLLGVSELWAKLGVAVLVVVVNYLTGFLVFRRKKGA